MIKKIFIPAILITLLAACNLTKEVEVDLPDYERQPVVEFFLEPGKPLKLLLTQSYGFFEPFDTSLNSFVDNIVLDSALVTVTHGGRVDTIPNQYWFDFQSEKFYNYYSPKLVAATVGEEWVLNIKLKDGRTIEGKTTMLRKQEIDSIVVEFNPKNDSLARVLTYMTDNPNEVNFYRRMLHYSSLKDSLAQQDFLVDDKLNQTNTIAFGSGYELKEGDTVFNTIFHITRDYYDYIVSYSLAAQGNINPFAQPSQIKSNVSGTSNPLGIFTCLVYDRDTTIVKK